MGDNVEQDFEWAVKNGELEQVKVIIETDSSVANKALPNGRYPLSVAADYGHCDVITFLTQHGASVNVVDKHGITPLLSAIFEGHTDCVKLLLEKGASKTGKAPDGRSYLDCADSDEIKALLK